MIDHLKQMAVFARVVDEGSFRAAANDLGLAPSRVSENVSELEKYLGVTLLYRSTRKISLTSEGRVFYGRVLEMLQSAEIGLNELNALSVAPVGTLNISMPAFLAAGALATAIADFVRTYPKVNFSVTYTDHRLHLVEDGIDLSIRVGWLDDSPMMSRKLAGGKRYVVVGTEYAKGRDMPKRPSDLANWEWIRFKPRPASAEFTSSHGEVESVTGKSRIELDNMEAVFHFAIQNSGVTILPSYLAERGIQAGQLVRLLPDWELEPLGVYAVWPDSSRRDSLALLFVRFLADKGLCQKSKMNFEADRP
ncbi:MAG: LysR family transcriptional regulator [Pseudomonadota bacterium]